MMTTTALTLAGGSLTFLAFLVVYFIAIGLGLYTRTGSGISQTPYADLDGSGPEKPSELAHDVTQRVSDWDRGTAGHHRHHRRTVARPPADPELRAALHEWRTASGKGHLAAPARGAGPVRGPTDGIDLVVFWDYTAPASASLAATLRQLRAVRHVRETAFHLPLADARPLAPLAAHALEAAYAQDRFWEAHDQLLAQTPADERAVLAVGDSLADMDRFLSAIRERGASANILADVKLAAASGVHAVPTVFIDGVRFDGDHRVDELTAAIDARGPAPTGEMREAATRRAQLPSSCEPPA